MIALGLVLSLLMGLTLGLLGGGGSILVVPILVFVFGMDARPALATSLLVVAVASITGAVQHARSGNVRLRIAAAFGGVAMLGSYAGARLAAFVPGTVLLLLFAATMVAAGTAMLRGGDDRATRATQRHPSLATLGALGLGVGLLTGLVGAGGGFLMVPVLTAFGGLPVHAAVGTSLVVIAVNASTALAGYLTHVTLNLRVAALVTSAAVAGSIVGGRLAGRVPAPTLRRSFAWLVLTMAAALVWKEVPMEVLTHPLVGPLLGGAVIGLAAAALLLFNGQIAGISGIVAGLLRPRPHGVGWRAAFVAGLLAGGVALAAWQPDWLGAPPSQPLALFALAGLLVGAGTRIGNGCTSGHGVCGIGRGSFRSLVATGAFMIAGVAAVFVTRHVLGGAP